MGNDEEGVLKGGKKELRERRRIKGKISSVFLLLSQVLIKTDDNIPISTLTGGICFF